MAQKSKLLLDTMANKLVDTHAEKVCLIVDDSNDVLLEYESVEHMEQVNITEDVKNSHDKEGTKDGSEKETGVMGGMYCFLEEESLVDLNVPDLEPLPYTPSASDDHRSFYISIPSLSMFYSDPLMGLGSDTGHQGYIVPMRTYEIFVGIHWSLCDGYIYWRSVRFFCGSLMEQIVIFAKPTFGLPIVRDYDESSQGSANLHSIHICEKNKWGSPGIDVYIACIVSQGSHGVLINACSSRFMCWKHDICHEIDVQSLIGINLGDRGKNKELRTIHIKYECER